MRSQQSGFTLIELIVVVVILGILSAFAVPRFFNLSGEARYANLQALAGSIRSAAALAHSKQLAAGAGAATSVTWGSNTVTMINRYPRASAAGVTAALESISGFTAAYSGDGTSAAHTATFSADGASGTCQVVYDPPDSTSATPTITISGSADNCS
jgi:MSHA pilin protein MshA